MIPSERESLADKGSWAPFMCPCCRGLFRAPSLARGETKCPFCKSSIQFIPSSSATTGGNEEDEIQPIERKRRRREPAAQSWDQKDSKPADQSDTRGIVLTSLFLISIAVAVGGFFLIKQRDQKNGSSFSEENSTADFKQFTPSSNGFTNSSKASEAEGDKPLLELEASDLDLARSATEKFLACQTVDEIAPLIRDSERVMPLAKEFYQRNPFDASGAHAIDEKGVAQVAKRFASFEVVLKNYQTKPIALELTDKGALVDWESWVGYCGQPWEEFIENKSKEPTFVRVTATRAFYFNFGFSNDREWACFRLMRSPDEQVLFGYTPSDADFLSSLPGDGEPEATFRLKIRYPDRPVVDNQVLITDFVGSGWVKGL